MSSVTLNASMRSNLLSLRNISNQMDKTQLILATGKKVNSAIDNASSYYQARSLTNRSADLNALLDGMEQGIQTIEAANVGIEKATAFLEQMSSIVEQAGTIVSIPSKEEIASRLGANGAVVTTAQELYDAINAGKETICVYGHIDLGNIDDAGKEINLKENQKLVGVGYFGDYDSDVDKFSSLTARAENTAKNMINVVQKGCLVSDLTVNYTNMSNSGSIYAVNAGGSQSNATLSNLDVNIYFGKSSGGYKAAICVATNVDIRGKININASNGTSNGIFLNTNSAVCNIEKSSINIKISGVKGIGIYSIYGGICNIDSESKINIQINTSESAYGIYGLIDTLFNINKEAQININLN